jgi:hypothetical protein
MKHIIPLYLILIHQILSNSVFGFENSYLSVGLFLFIQMLMIVFLLENKKYSYLRLGSIFLLGLALILWGLFKDNLGVISSSFITIFVAYYVVSLNGVGVLKKHLVYIVIASFLLSIIQISGVSEFAHFWNSQFINEQAGVYVREIKIYDILGGTNLDLVDSRQTRPTGIFHSSAVLGLVYTSYIAYIFSGNYKSKRHIYFVPWLIVFSGSKLVLLSTILMLFCSFNSIPLRILAGMLLSAFVSIICHNILYDDLAARQFGYAMAYTSIDARMRIYFDMTLADAIESFNHSRFYIELLGFFLISTIGAVYFRKANYTYQVLIIGLTTSIIATPQPGNLLLGLFLIPAFFYQAQLSRNVNLGQLP